MSAASTSSSREKKKKWASSYVLSTLSELNTQKRIALPLMAMNLAWYAKIAVTTAFLGDLGDLELAGGTLGFTFANVTGYSILNGLCFPMEPICGQAFGAKNFKLLHKTLLITVILLLLTSIPISATWLFADTILTHFGQNQNITIVSKTYLLHLIPDLIISTILYPLKTYLTSQGTTIPTMIASGSSAAFHVPLTMFLSRKKGIAGVAMAIWVSDLIVLIQLILYVAFTEIRRGFEGWSRMTLPDWVVILRLCGPCLLTTCLEWWCYEILILLAGRMNNPKCEVDVIAIVLNFDYLLYTFMLSLAMCASIRVANELGAERPDAARLSAMISVSTGFVCGVLGGGAMGVARGIWGDLFSRDVKTKGGVRKAMVVMAIVEVVNFPVVVCGGVVRGTARPVVGVYASVVGFYVVGLPVAWGLGLGLGMGVEGLLVGLLCGVVVCMVLLMGFFGRFEWGEEAGKVLDLMELGGGVLDGIVAE